MVFSSMTFLLVFLPLLILIYFAVPSKCRKLRNYILLAFSLAFYAWGEPLFIFLILAALAATYLVSAKVGEKSKWALALAVALNLIPLIVFKYIDFLITNTNFILGTEIPMTELPLPIGISFYTFQILTYIIDLYKGSVKRQNNPLYLALYILLFPKLILGPIVKYSTIENSIENRNENRADFSEGLMRFVLGLSKKVLISNQAGYIVKTIIQQDAGMVGPGLVWLAVFSYTIQIYFDFSGYSDMAIGLGKMFGFQFLENFNYPYASKSVSEFWRRWHISLSTFFRDYVYIPLGGNRVTTLRWFLNVLTVWLLTGLWHGSYWNYIIWGLYYCMFLILEKLFLNKILQKIPGIFCWAYTFIVTLVGWAIFMTETNNPAVLLSFLGRMFAFSSVEMGHTIRSLEIQSNIPYIIIGFVLSFPWLKKLKEKYAISSVMKGSAAKATVLIVCNIGICLLYIASLIFIIAESFNPFIYFRF